MCGGKFLHLIEFGNLDKDQKKEIEQGLKERQAALKQALGLVNQGLKRVKKTGSKGRKTARR
jgi:hypothetical protein